VGAGRIIGVMLAVAGAWFLWTGMKARDSFKERATEALIGRNTERTNLYIAGGGAAVVGGVLLMLFGGGGRRR
jgi:hypothetical protein